MPLFSRIEYSALSRAGGIGGSVNTRALGAFGDAAGTLPSGRTIGAPSASFVPTRRPRSGATDVPSTRGAPAPSTRKPKDAPDADVDAPKKPKDTDVDPDSPEGKIQKKKKEVAAKRKKIAAAALVAAAALTVADRIIAEDEAKKNQKACVGYCTPRFTTPCNDPDLYDTLDDDGKMACGMCDPGPPASGICPIEQNSLLYMKTDNGDKMPEKINGVDWDLQPFASLDETPGAYCAELCEETHPVAGIGGGLKAGAENVVDAAKKAVEDVFQGMWDKLGLGEFGKYLTWIFIGLLVVIFVVIIIKLKNKKPTPPTEFL
jgi:hypothetical protein